MQPFLRNKIDIRGHHHKGLYTYVCCDRKTNSSGPPVICTLSCAVTENNFDTKPETEDVDAFIPRLTFSFKTGSATLRRWNPHSCTIAAALTCGLVHFPVRPGSCVFLINTLLNTLSHFADIVGSTGRLICVMGETFPMRPSQHMIANFMKAYPNSTIVTANEHEASLETYQRLLSVPASSKCAFAMAFHPRLGANSPARLLLFKDTEKVLRLIFSFLECNDAAKSTCFCACNWPTGTHVDVVRNVVVSHVDMVKKWKGSEQQGPLCFFLDLPRFDIATRSRVPDEGDNMYNVIEEFKRFPSGEKTGLAAKEQLFLAPYFPRRTLLMFKVLPPKVASEMQAPLHLGEAPISSPPATSLPAPSFKTRPTALFSATPPVNSSMARKSSTIPQGKMQSTSRPRSVNVDSGMQHQLHTDWDRSMYGQMDGVFKSPPGLEALYGGEGATHTGEWQSPAFVMCSPPQYGLGMGAMRPNTGIFMEQHM